jgi:hypothetical protein
MYGGAEQVTRSSDWPYVRRYAAPSVDHEFVAGCFDPPDGTVAVSLEIFKRIGLAVGQGSTIIKVGALR